MRPDRVIDVVSYGSFNLNGTSGPTDFDRDGLSAPTRSDTELRTTTSYNSDGTVQDVTDPRGLVRRTEYPTTRAA